jgi:glycosyltransferase involved in cell wall biosynthesis
MACGAAVLVSPEANRSKLVRSGENGFVYHEEDEMARHLVTLLAQRRAAGDSLRRRARETVVERHSMAAAAGAATQLWDTLRREHASWP